MVPHNIYRLYLNIFLAFTVSSCAILPSETSEHGVAMSMNSSPDKSFTLRTTSVDNKLAFMGVGGEINEVVNPDLKVQEGDTVQIILVNDDGMQHDLAVPELNAATKLLLSKGESAEIIFLASKNGSFEYYCTVAGHRQAGMLGKLVVGQPDSKNEPVSERSVVKAPNDLPGPLSRSEPKLVHVTLETKEAEARLADGSSYKFWTFNGKVPGPFIRVRVGDTVEVTLSNSADSEYSHSVDFHAATGPGGGAAVTQTKPGESTSFSFKALAPGLFVYHCATPLVAHHIANGMYGLILVEPEEGLPAVSKEFYVMQGEVYTNEELGSEGILTFDIEKMLDESPEYFIFNGSVGSLTDEAPLSANVGDAIRIFFGVGGPNFASSFHVIGEIFDRVYNLASLTSIPLTNVQTTIVPPGGATMVEFSLDVPGRYLLVDHALSRMERGLVGFLVVEGPENPEIFNGSFTEGSGH